MFNSLMVFDDNRPHKTDMVHNGVVNLVATRGGRRWVFALLYLSEGAPIGLIWWALPTILRAGDTAIEEITATIALLVFPWTLKFLWAPLVDVGRSRWWGHRAWILSAQLVMGLTLLPMIWLDVVDDLNTVRLLLFAHAFAATIQDVAIDGWAIAITPEKERARVSGSMFVGHRTGMWLFGAGLLLVLNQVPHAVAITSLIGVVWGTSILVVCSKDISLAVPRWGEFTQILKRAFSTRNTWLGIAFALTAGAAFEAAGGMAGPFLYDLGLVENQVGWFISATIPCMLLGAWLGGTLADRLGHNRLAGMGVLWMAVMVALLAPDQPNESRIGLLLLMYLGFGWFTASSYALFMDQTDPKLGGTQFSTYMGATNGCEMWSVAMFGAIFARWNDYGQVFLVMAGLSLISLPILRAIGRQAKKVHSA